MRVVRGAQSRLRRINHIGSRGARVTRPEVSGPFRPQGNGQRATTQSPDLQGTNSPATSRNHVHPDTWRASAATESCNRWMTRESISRSKDGPAVGIRQRLFSTVATLTRGTTPDKEFPSRSANADAQVCTLLPGGQLHIPLSASQWHPVADGSEFQPCHKADEAEDTRPQVGPEASGRRPLISPARIRRVGCLERSRPEANWLICSPRNRLRQQAPCHGAFCFLLFFLRLAFP